jgi:hypothetical protein
VQTFTGGNHRPLADDPKLGLTRASQLGDDWPGKATGEALKHFRLGRSGNRGTGGTPSPVAEIPFFLLHIFYAGGQILLISDSLLIETAGARSL